MSYYFVKMGINTRSSGGSALRRSAYQRCANDPCFDFSHKIDELVDADVMLPEGADLAYQDPVTLWSAVEAKENRVNSQLCRTFEISIPNEVPKDLRADFAREMLQPFVDHGLPVEWAIHQEEAIFQDVENPHISAAIGFRQLDANGWAKGKDREMNKLMRDDPHGKFWVPAMNAFFEKHRIDAHVEHKSNHTPVASPAVRRLAKRWKRDGANPERMPALLARFMAHREAHLAMKNEEIDLIAEIEQMETAMKSDATTSDTKENNDGERDNNERRAGTGSRADRGYNRSDQRSAGRERDGRRVSTGAGDGTDRRLPGIDRRKDSQDRRSTEHIRRAARGKLSRTIAQRIRNDDAAAKHLDRFSALNTAKQKTSVTTLLQRIVRNDVATRFIKRLEALTEKIKDRKEVRSGPKAIEIRAIAERSDAIRNEDRSTPAPKSRFPKDGGAGYSPVTRTEHLAAGNDHRKPRPSVEGQQQDRSSAAPVDRQAVSELAKAAKALRPLSDDLKGMPIHHSAPVGYGGAEALPDPSDPLILQKISQMNARQMSRPGP